MYLDGNSGAYNGQLKLDKPQIVILSAIHVDTLAATIVGGTLELLGRHR